MPVHRIKRTDLIATVHKLERESREEVVAAVDDGDHVLVFTRAVGWKVEQR